MQCKKHQFDFVSSCNVSPTDVLLYHLFTKTSVNDNLNFCSALYTVLQIDNIICSFLSTIYLRVYCLHDMRFSQWHWCSKHILTSMKTLISICLQLWSKHFNSINLKRTAVRTFLWNLTYHSINWQMNIQTKVKTLETYYSCKLLVTHQNLRSTAIRKLFWNLFYVWSIITVSKYTVLPTCQNTTCS